MINSYSVHFLAAMCCLHLSFRSAFHASTNFQLFLIIQRISAKDALVAFQSSQSNLLRTSFSLLDYVPRFPSSSPPIVTVAMGQSELVDWHGLEGQKKVGWQTGLSNQRLRRRQPDLGLWLSGICFSTVILCIST